MYDAWTCEGRLNRLPHQLFYWWEGQYVIPQNEKEGLSKGGWDSYRSQRLTSMHIFILRGVVEIGGLISRLSVTPLSIRDPESFFKNTLGNELHLFFFVWKIRFSAVDCSIRLWTGNSWIIIHEMLVSVLWVLGKVLPGYEPTSAMYIWRLWVRISPWPVYQRGDCLMLRKRS